MIAEAGLAALWLAATMALLQLALGALAVGRGQKSLAPAIAPVALTQAALCSLAFACLIVAFMRSDMSVLLVAANSHSAKPMIYKIAGTWGNHEGSMLLWVTILGLAGATIALFENKLRADTKLATLAAQAAIALGFYAFLLFASNPFTRITGVAEGAGLNPLLQDPGLAFHPPTLYAGYVGMSAAFSFAVGALITRDVGPAFARAMRPWVLGAWILLTIGITAGSYWAYYTLGWGGWWFWDPVENASLMPWLAATALLHSVTVLATRDGLRAWTIMLSVLAFSMSMVGTFLVRSGILTSVHSFAVDPQRGLFLLGLLAIYISGALALFAIRVGTVTEGNRFDLFSREAALVINNLILTVILVIVLAGTLYPLILEAANGSKISVGAPYFNSVAGPLAVGMMVLLAAGPLLRWRSDRPVAVIDRLAPALFAGAIALLLLAAFGGSIGVLPFLGLVAAAILGVASLAPLWKRDLRRTPLFTWGMVIAHFGCALSVAGMASDSAFTTENMVSLAANETRPIGPFQVTLSGVREKQGPNYQILEAVLTVRKGESAPFEMTPQLHAFSQPQMTTNQAAIETYWNGQLYITLGEDFSGDKFLLRMWWKPFVTLIWIGGVLIALGGALALLGRVRRDLWGKPWPWSRVGAGARA
ncbi:heme lyase CcmF/NrfE family subunit [Novosphingobium ginsenosidimutans]|uniref:Heme lyase CcmF/NrfE family subunit n=1 Tax=Novosphingobium ginsenosidimutans TaxID=1176536 RepID=A0A5B8S228_9SPHN|nr:heme lyase CcmF/NrfE family subunit [Novosphingobium ginsenosidimutans]QEA15184.1 heme lyase CcmF/NrfE family subunit [Novosphingobium ginsenosidimutans]